MPIAKAILSLVLSYQYVIPIQSCMVPPAAAEVGAVATRAAPPVVVPAGIIRDLRFCKQTRQRATFEPAIQFLHQTEAKRLLSAAGLERWKEALRWFFREGGKESRAHVPPVPSPPSQRRGRDARATAADVPLPAAADLGKTAWEQKLIQVLRSQHYQWRTEQTYRQWAWRFARWLEQHPVGSDRRADRAQPENGGAPGHPTRSGDAAVVCGNRALPTAIESATAGDVRDFLTDLATRSRISASTQKQGLNALVFLLREALERDPGEFGDFVRAARTVRVPVVLSRDECRQLFAALDGTARLRIKDVDIDRGQILVRAGKGDKDRVTMLPLSLSGRLREHRDTLRRICEKDRAAGLAGVWLLEGLDQKYPKAGEAWEWQWFFPSRERLMIRAPGCGGTMSWTRNCKRRCLTPAGAPA